MSNRKNSKRKTNAEAIQYMRFIALDNGYKLLTNEWHGSEYKYTFVDGNENHIKIKYHILLMRGWPYKYTTKKPIKSEVKKPLTLISIFEENDFDKIYLILKRIMKDKENLRKYSVFFERGFAKEFHFLKHSKKNNEYNSIYENIKTMIAGLDSLLSIKEIKVYMEV